MRTATTAILAVLSLGVAGCASDAASLDTAPMGVVRAAQSSLEQRPTQATAAGLAPRRSGVPTHMAAGETPTPPAGPRPRNAEPARALPASAAAGLAAGVCAQHMAARAGRFPAVVRARGEARALAVVTDSTAAALLGLPVVAPPASRPARKSLHTAHARLTLALAADADATAAELARATASRIRDYARALNIAGCG